MSSRVCRKCGEEKSSEFFSPFKQGKHGLYPVCKECRKPASAKNYRNQSDEYKLWYRAKRRAKVKGLDFSIEIEDIKIPNVCPVFGIKDFTPSLDRLDSSKGYTKDNILVMSNRANVLKNNGTIEEFNKIISFLVAIGSNVE